MKAKLAALLVALALWAVALPASAQMTYLDDPAITAGDATDRVMVSAAADAGTPDATAFSSPAFTAAGALRMNATLVVSECTACNLSLQIETQDPDGTWWNWCNAVAVTATGTTRTGLGRAATTASALTGVCNAAPPGRFRATVLWNSGTTATFTVQGVLW